MTMKSIRGLKVNWGSPLAKGLVHAFFPFDDIMYDIVRAEKTSAATTTSTTSSRLGTAADFQGTSGWVFLESQSQLANVDDNITVSAWFNTTDTGGLERILSFDSYGGGPAGDRFEIATNLSGSTVAGVANDHIGMYLRHDGTWRDVGAFDSGKWTHIVAKYKTSGSEGLTVFINGKQTYNLSLGTASLDLGHMTIGMRFNSTLPINGLYLHLALWDRALTDPECLALYKPATRFSYLRKGNPVAISLGIAAATGLEFTAQQGLVHVTGQNPSVLLGRQVTSQQGLVNVTGQNPTVLLGREVTAQQGLVHVTGQDVIVTTGREFEAQQGLVHVTGQNVEVLRGREVTAQQGLVHVTGQNVEVTNGLTVESKQGLVHVTGQNPDVLLGRKVDLQQGLVNVTGQNPTVLLGREVTAQQGLVNVTGQNVTVSLGRQVDVQQGLVHITGRNVGINNVLFQSAWTRNLNRIETIGERSQKS